jgi:hypothetical protein
MKPRILYFFLVFIFQGPLAFCQDDTVSRKYLDLYIDVSIANDYQEFPITDTSYLEIGNEEYGVSNFSIGITKANKNGWNKRYSVFAAIINYSDDYRIVYYPSIQSKTTVFGEKNLNLNVEGLIEYSKVVKSFFSEKIHIYAGLALNPFVNYYRISPHIIGQNSHSTRLFSFGCDVAIVPSIQYHLHGRTFLNLQAPIEFFRLWHFRQRYLGASPGLANSNGTDALFGLKMPVVRLGISISL